MTNTVKQAPQNGSEGEIVDFYKNSLEIAEQRKTYGQFIRLKENETKYFIILDDQHTAIVDRLSNFKMKHQGIKELQKVALFKVREIDLEQRKLGPFKILDLSFQFANIVGQSIKNARKVNGDDVHIFMLSRGTGTGSATNYTLTACTGPNFAQFAMGYKQAVDQYMRENHKGYMDLIAQYKEEAAQFRLEKEQAKASAAAGPAANDQSVDFSAQAGE